jgi:hypothetical protein
MAGQGFRSMASRFSVAPARSSTAGRETLSRVSAVAKTRRNTLLGFRRAGEAAVSHYISILSLYDTTIPPNPRRPNVNGNPNATMSPTIWSTASLSFLHLPHLPQQPHQHPAASQSRTRDRSNHAYSISKWTAAVRKRETPSASHSPLHDAVDITFPNQGHSGLRRFGVPPSHDHRHRTSKEQAHDIIPLDHPRSSPVQEGSLFDVAKASQNPGKFPAPQDLLCSADVVGYRDWQHLCAKKLSSVEIAFGADIR